MNKIILEQLESVKYAQIPTTLKSPIHINKVVDIPSYDVKVGRTYIIAFENYIINEPDGFTLSVNWNNGTHPTSYCVRGIVEDIVGKMVKLSTIGYDKSRNELLTDTWEGWIPMKGFKVLKDLGEYNAIISSKI